MLQPYAIEPAVPAVGTLTPPQLRGAAETSNAALSKPARKAQSRHSKRFTGMTRRTAAPDAPPTACDKRKASFLEASNSAGASA